MMTTIDATTISRLNSSATIAAVRIDKSSWLPWKVITPAAQRPASVLLSAVKIAAEIATPNAAPSDEAIL